MQSIVAHPGDNRTPPHRYLDRAPYQHDDYRSHAGGIPAVHRGEDVKDRQIRLMQERGIWTAPDKPLRPDLPGHEGGRKRDGPEAPSGGHDLMGQSRYGGRGWAWPDDPHWRDLILFYEYFHGDNGAGLGASHQTGWTGLVARLIQTLGQLDAATVLEDHRWPLARPYRRLTAEPVADVSTAREARGVSEQKQPD
jgi:hypothetical protein